MEPLWNHQIDMINFAQDRKAVLWHCGMGTGKSRAAIELIKAKAPPKVLITSPHAVVSVWEHQLKLFSTFEYTAVFLNKGSVKKKTELAEYARKLAVARDEPLIIVINYESAWRPPFNRWLLTQRWDMVIADECFPAGTMIDTPSDEKPIEMLKKGDIIWGFDHSKNEVVETVVQHTFQNVSNRLINVDGIIMTSSHPVWTIENGYIAADSLTALDTVCYIRQKGDGDHGENQKAYSSFSMPEPKMRKNVPRGQTKPSVLFKKLQVSPYVYSKPEVKNHVQPNPDRSQAKGRCNGKDIHAPEFGIEPLQSTNRTQKSTHSTQGSRLQTSQWRKRKKFANTTKIARRKARLANRSCCADKTETTFPISACLQNRHSRSNIENRDRGGRPIPFSQSTNFEGFQEIKIPGINRLGNPESQKQRDNGKSRQCSGYVDVYNIQTGTENYFANGLLVHNCHNLKSPGGKASNYFAKVRLIAKQIIGLSGTPLPHSPLDAYGLYRFLDPSIFGRNFHFFKTTYAILKTIEKKPDGDESKKDNPFARRMKPIQIVVGFKNTEDFARKFNSIRIHVTRDVLDLPEAVHNHVSVELPPAAQRIYKSLDKQFFADLDTGEITAAHALTRLLRLQQLTGGHLKTDEGVSTVVHTAKAEALKTLMEGIEPEEPIAIFCRFTSDIAFCHDMVKKVGRKSVELSGQRKELKSWSNDQNVLVAQIRTAREGIDLTFARYNIYYSLGYSLAEYEQSLARSHRPGQTKTMFYYHLIAVNTVDVKVYKALRERRDVIDAIINDR